MYASTPVSIAAALCHREMDTSHGADRLLVRFDTDRTNDDRILR
jgi:hypothetical protein